MLNKLVLVKAIEDRENGVMPNFSNVEINQAVDLVIFNGYDIDVVCKMNDQQLDMASNPEDFEDFGDYYICPVCGEKVAIEYDGERYEGYTGECDNCHLNIEISAYVLDDMDMSDTHKTIQNILNSNFKKLHDEYIKTAGKNKIVFKNKTILAVGEKVTCKAYNSESRSPYNRYKTITSTIDNLGLFEVTFQDGTKIHYFEIETIKKCA